MVAAPSTQLVDAYLEEIARGYGVAWTAPARAAAADETTHDDAAGAKASFHAFFPLTHISASTRADPRALLPC